jgi:opacity protein-like surface antigen
MGGVFMNRYIFALLGLVCFGCFSLSGNAQESGSQKPIRASLNSDHASPSASVALSPYYAGVQKSSGYIGFFGGSRIDEMFSVEAQYLKFDGVQSPGGTTTASSFGVAGIAMFPLRLSDNVPPFSLFAKGGVDLTFIKEPYYSCYFTSCYSYGERKSTKINLTLGGGAQYDFNKSMSARVGLGVSGYNTDVYIAGIFKF